MEHLYAPWRMKYISSAQNKKSEECIFCAKLRGNQDREEYVVYRGQSAFVVMNIYPYNTGHLMIVPHQHIGDLASVPAKAQAEMMHLAGYFTELLKETLRPDGFNIGLNLGKAAGAGMADHLHMHLVPRWSGDSNFMSVVGDTRVLPETLNDTYQKIVAAVQNRPPKI